MPEQEMMQVPRPAPGHVAIVACEEDGACSWLSFASEDFTDEDWLRDMGQYIPHLLAEGVRKLREAS